MRDIREIIKAIGVEDSFSNVSDPNSIGIEDDFTESTYDSITSLGIKKVANYTLSKDGVMLLITGYSIKIRRQLIQYIRELEDKLAKPKTRLELAKEQVIMIAEIERLEKRGNLMMIQREDSSFVTSSILAKDLKEVRVELDDVIEEHQLYTISELLEGTGISAIKGNKVLNSLGIIYKVGKSWDFKEGKEKYGKTFEHKKFTIIKYYSHMNVLDLILKNI